MIDRIVGFSASQVHYLRHAATMANRLLQCQLSHLLAGDQVTPVALGMHSRRLVERLVRHHLGWRQGGLYRGIQELQQQGVSPWMVSCLHQVRVFGNWMGHPSPPERRQSVTPVDLATMLGALHRVLESYPWR